MPVNPPMQALPGMLRRRSRPLPRATALPMMVRTVGLPLLGGTPAAPLPAVYTATETVASLLSVLSARLGCRPSSSCSRIKQAGTREGQSRAQLKSAPS